MATAVNETSPKRDTRARRLISKLERTFWFTGTPLKTAEEIMGPQMHRIQDVSMHLGHPSDFLTHFRHLEMVPYKEDELIWAAQNGVILTLHSVGVRRMARSFPSEIVIPHDEDFLHACHDKDIRTPRSPQWWLMLRPTSRGKEIQVQRDQPKKMRKRMDTASLGVTVSGMYLDYKIHGLLPDGLRLTSGTRISFDSEEQRLLVGENILHGKNSSIRIVVGRSDALQYMRSIAWEPHKVRHPEVY